MQQNPEGKWRVEFDEEWARESSKTADAEELEEKVVSSDKGKTVDAA